MEITKIKAAAEIAKSRTNDKRWLNAIDKAVAGVESGWWVITELHDCLAVTTETGKTYFANGVCQCKSFEFGQACRHRALYRLYQIAQEEAAPAAVSCGGRGRPFVDGATRPHGLCEDCDPGQEPDIFADEKAERASLIADIERAWPQKFPHDDLADALMYRFKRNKLEMLSIDLLQAIHAIL